MIRWTPERKLNLLRVLMQAPLERRKEIMWNYAVSFDEVDEWAYAYAYGGLKALRATRKIDYRVAA